MRIETPEVKREDGSKFKIVINVSEEHYCKLSWKLADVQTKEPRKRTWVSHANEIERSFQYSGIPYDERFKIKQQKLVDLVGEEWVKKRFSMLMTILNPIF